MFHHSNMFFSMMFHDFASPCFTMFHHVSPCFTIQTCFFMFFPLIFHDFGSPCFTIIVMNIRKNRGFVTNGSPSMVISTSPASPVTGEPHPRWHCDGAVCDLGSLVRLVGGRLFWETNHILPLGIGDFTGKHT